MIFSTFVSLVFWGAPAKRLYDHLRKLAAVVQPMGLQVGPPLLSDTMPPILRLCCSQAAENEGTYLEPSVDECLAVSIICNVSENSSSG